MHSWGDEWFEKYGPDLYKAEEFIQRYVKRHSLCTLVSKEKWGTLRYEWILPPPSRIFFKHRWEWYWNTSKLYGWWYKLGKSTLKRAVKKAAKKWPHLKEELWSDYDY